MLKSTWIGSGHHGMDKVLSFSSPRILFVFFVYIITFFFLNYLFYFFFLFL